MINLIKNRLFFFSLLFVCIDTYAQKRVDGLISAEKSFAAYSVAHSTKEAFLKFLDSIGIVFDNGKPVNGIATWSKREKRPGVLNWYPQHAEIAASGDFGYTTGPWTFQTSLKDTVAARGQYTTVWHIDKNGEWKFLVDLGVTGTPASADTGIYIVDRSDPAYYKGTLQSMLKTEKEFIKAIKKSIKEAYQKNSSKAYSILNRNDFQPAWFQDAYYRVYKSTPVEITYTTNGYGIASTNDLGYVYGTTIINDKTDNYLRIWRREKDGWKIALEVLRY